MDRQKYKQLVKLIKDLYPSMSDYCKEKIEGMIPELKESEDEKIRKDIIKVFTGEVGFTTKEEAKKYVAWLEKQGEPIDKEEVLIGARKGVALSIMNFLDRNTLGMCLSNMECKDLEDAVVDSDWSKVYNYMKKKLEKQGEHQSIQEIEPFEAEHGKYYYCIKDYFSGGKKFASKGNVVQALRGLPIMGLEDISEYFLPVNFIKCSSTWSKEDVEMIDLLISILEINHPDEYFKSTDKGDVNMRAVPTKKIINWLKSLKERMKGEQSYGGK